MNMYVFIYIYTYKNIYIYTYMHIYISKMANYSLLISLQACCVNRLVHSSGDTSDISEVSPDEVSRRYLLMSEPSDSRNRLVEK